MYPSIFIHSSIYWSIHPSIHPSIQPICSWHLRAYEWMNEWMHAVECMNVTPYFESKPLNDAFKHFRFLQKYLVIIIGWRQFMRRHYQAAPHQHHAASNDNHTRGRHSTMVSLPFPLCPRPADTTRVDNHIARLWLQAHIRRLSKCRCLISLRFN